MHQSFGPFMKKGVLLSSGCNRTANLRLRSVLESKKNAAELATISEALGRGGETATYLLFQFLKHSFLRIRMKGPASCC